MSAVLGLFILIPIYTSIYMQALGDLKLFIASENNSKQQQLIQQIFEDHNEGVVLIKSEREAQPANLADPPAKKVLFHNSAFAEILGGDDVE